MYFGWKFPGKTVVGTDKCYTNPVFIHTTVWFRGLILYSYSPRCPQMKRANTDNDKVNKSMDVAATFGTNTCLPNRRKQLFTEEEAYGLLLFWQQDAVSPCWPPVASDQPRGGCLRWDTHMQVVIHICLCFFYPADHMLILSTCAVSCGMSHTLSPQPGKHEEQRVGVTNATNKVLGPCSVLEAAPATSPSRQASVLFILFYLFPDTICIFIMWPTSVCGVRCVCICVCLHVWMAASWKRSELIDRSQQSPQTTCSTCHTCLIWSEVWVL